MYRNEQSYLLYSLHFEREKDIAIPDLADRERQVEPCRCAGRWSERGGEGDRRVERLGFRDFTNS